MLKSVTIRSTLAAVACAITFTAHAFADAPKRIDVEAGDLMTALESLSKQTAVDLVYQPDQIRPFHTAGVKGKYTSDAAIRILLKDTPLELHRDQSGAMVITPPHTASPTEASKALPNSDKPQEPGSYLPLGQTNQGSAPTNAPVREGERSRDNAAGRTSDNKSKELEEIIVTAQKRSERLQDVPVPVTALDAETLTDNNQLRLQDYYTSVPGFMVAPTSKQTSQFLAIRGLSTGVGSPTVGIVIDDIPYGSSTALGGGQGIPDLDPGDLARIEVLRGPQGTLYGANSLGGLAKFVTVDPSTDAVSGRVQVGGDAIHNGNGLGYNVRGSVNVPLSDSLAVRASGFVREEPGYINNPIRDLKGVNKETDNGGRLSLLWRPSDTVSLKLGAMYQKTNIDGVGAADLLPGLGDLQQAYVLDDLQQKAVQAYSAILNANLGAATLTSLTGYNISWFSDLNDGTKYYAGAFAPFFGGAQGVAQTNYSKTKKFSEEVRLSVPLGEKFDWLLGGFYSKESTAFNIDFYGVDTANQQVVGTIFTSIFPTSYKEYAGFTDLTYKVTDQFDIQVGARESRFEQHAFELDDGVIYNTFFFRPPRPNPFLTAPPETKPSSFTYLLTPRFRFTQDLMAYARLTSGFRAGGVNITTAPGVPQSFNPDKTQNYELGLKGDFLEHTLSIDASVYYIDWKDIQLFLVDPVSGAGYFANGGKAKSQGVELSVQSKPVTGLTIGGWVAWNNAELTQNLPPSSVAAGQDGDRLPYSASFSGKLSAEQDFPLRDRLNGFVGAEVSYVSDRQGSFPTPPAARTDLPAYARTDVRTGVHYESWTANLYVNNVADRRGILLRGSDAALPWSVQYIQPRTVGLALAKTF
jgi:iron complex outermembrane receptor protein